MVVKPEGLTFQKLKHFANPPGLQMRTQMRLYDSMQRFKHRNKLLCLWIKLPYFRSFLEQIGKLSYLSYHSLQGLMFQVHLLRKKVQLPVIRFLLFDFQYSLFVLHRNLCNNSCFSSLRIVHRTRNLSIKLHLLLEAKEKQNGNANITKQTNMQKRCSNVHFFAEYTLLQVSVIVLMSIFTQNLNTLQFILKQHSNYYNLGQSIILLIFYILTNISFNNQRKQIMSERKYTLIVQWFDPSASLIRQFYFTYYLPNHQIQMHDMKNHKVFLKKIQYPQIKLDDLYIGNVLSCYGRQLKIIDFGDQFTKKNLLGESVSNKTCALIKPDCYLNMGKIIAEIQKDFSIGNLKMFKMSKANADTFYGEHIGKQFYPGLLEFITSDYTVGLQLVSVDAVKKWRSVIGPTNSTKAKSQAPQSIRAKFGTDGRKNAVHGSESPVAAQRQLGYIFSRQYLRSQPLLSNCSLCIIKPHIVKKKLLGQIINQILQAGFEISAMQMIWLDPAVAQQFYQVYKFLPECKRMIDQLSSGPSVALQVRQESAVEQFRSFCGPYDPEIAKKLEPQSLRAKYGVDRVLNAVHCTDLPQDGPLQVHFIFDTLIG